jgi:hypothetical protein
MRQNRPAAASNSPTTPAGTTGLTTKTCLVKVSSFVVA